MKRNLIVLFFALSQLICALSFAQSYSVLLTSVDSNQKLATIKIVREVSGLGLKESKTIVDSVEVSVPTVVPLSDKSQSGALAAVESLASVNASSIAFVGTSTPVGFGSCGETVYWALCDGVLTISGSGEMTDLTVQTSRESPWYSERSTIVEVVVCEGVTTLGDYAFYECEKITKATLPSTLNEIHWGAFWSCTKLSDINLPEGLSTIDVRAFSGCSQLKTVAFPSTLTTIGNFAFAGISFNDIYFNSQPSIGTSVFSTQALSSAVAHTSSMSYVSSLTEYGFANVEIGGTCGDKVTWSYDTTTLEVTISGTGPMRDYEAQESPWWTNGTVQSIVIEEGVTTVGTNAFTWDYNLETVSLPSTLTSIGDNAFNLCYCIKTIYANSVPTFGTDAFDSDTKRSCTVIASSEAVAAAYRQAGFSHVANESTMFTIYLTVTDEGTPLDPSDYDWTSVSVYTEDGVYLGRSQIFYPYVEDKAPLRVTLDASNPAALDGKTLTFHLNVESPQNESATITDGYYSINPDGVLLNNAVTTVKYTQGGEAGSITNPITLNYVALQSLSLPTTVSLKVGETINTNDLLTITPSNASLPSNYIYFNTPTGNPYVSYLNNGNNLSLTGISSTSNLSASGLPVCSWTSSYLNVSGEFKVSVTEDPNSCVYFLNIVSDGEALSTYGLPEQRFVTVQPYIDGVAYGDPLLVLSYENSAATSGYSYYYYALNVPAATYRGKEVSFHVIMDFDEEYLREIGPVHLPMSGEYIVNTISYNNYTSNSQIPVKAGTVYGSITSPVLLNYKNLNGVYLNSSVEVAVGKSVDLNDYYTTEPSDASMPVDFDVDWWISDEEYATLSGSTLTGVKATPSEDEQSAWGSFTYSGGDGEISGGGEFPYTVTDPNMMTVWFEITDEGAAFDYSECAYMKVSAFANGDSIGVSTFEPVWTQNQQFMPRFKLSFVPKNPSKLKGKELTFHLITSAASAFEGSRETATIETDGAYIIHPSCVTLNGKTTKVTYQPGKTWGSPEVPVVLDYMNLNSVSVTNPIELQVGQTVVLNDYVSYNPANASVPVNFEVGWSWTQNDKFTIGESTDGKTTLTGNSVLPYPGETISWNAQYQYYGNTRIVISDPNNCCYILSIEADGQPLNSVSWGASEMDYITVTPYVSGNAVGEPQSVQTFLDFSTQTPKYYFYYNITIPGTYAGKTVEFHVTTAYDSELLYEIEGNTLPMSGEYIIRDVSLMLEDGVTTSIPVQKGTVWGTITYPVILNYVTPTSISTTPASLSMTVGDTYNLNKVKYTFNPATSSVPVSFSPEWTVGNYVDYIKVSKKNVLTALKETPEQETISVDGFTDNYPPVSIPITLSERVIPVTGVTIPDANKKQVVWLGENWREAYLTLDDLYEITPSDATNQDVTWTSSDESVAVIDGGGNEFGEWYAVGQKVGNTTLTVTTVDGGKTDTLNLEVRAHVTGIQLKKESVTVNRGSTVTLSTYIKSVLPANAYDKSVTWAVTDTATVVTVSQTSSGTWRMKANRVGVTTLQVTSVDNPQVVAYLTVEVESKVTAITIPESKKKQVVWLGDNWMDAYLPLDNLYEITPSDAVNQEVTWTSSDESVAVIDGGSNEFGEWYAVGQKVGNTTLTVTTVDGGKTDTLNLEVRAHVTGIQLKKESVKVNRGSTVTLSTYIKSVLPANAYDKSVKWAVTDTATVVTVSQTSSGTWRMKANRVGVTTLQVTSVDNPQVTAFLTVTVESSVTGVTVEEPNQILYIGEEANLKYTIQPADASGTSVTWTSSDESVIKIVTTPTGTSAVAQKVGTATLTVTTAEGGKTATISVEVRAHVTSIELKNENVTVKRGSTTNLSNYIKSVLLTDAYDKSVTWAVTDTSTVVTVSKSLAGTWQMKANHSGTATLQVTSVDNPQAVAFLTVTVESSVTGVTVAEPSQIVYIGETVNLSYTIQPSDATNKAVTWKSSDESVVKVTETPNGAVPYTAVAQKVGTATLTITTSDGGKTATISVEVRAHVESITLKSQSVTINRGSTVDLSNYIQSILPEDAYDKSVRWAVTDTATVVTVSQKKNAWQMKANRVGTTTLQVTSVDNPQAVAFLTVIVESKVTGITVEEPDQILYIGESANLNYTIQPSDASNKEVTWKSSNNGIVKVEQTPTGYTAVAQKVGAATLTVTTAEGGKKASIKIEVRAHVESITLNTQRITVNRGSTVNLTQYIASILPEEAYDKSVKWTSGSPNIVCINGSTAVANAIGTCRVTAASVDNPRATASLEIVVEAAAAGIYATNPVQTVWIGEDVDLSYYFVPADATSTIKSWSSSDPSVVAISGGSTTAYRAVAQKSGEAILTVTTDNGQTATIEVTVHAHVESITLTKKSVTVNRGSSTDLSKYIKSILPEDAYDKSVTWAVSDTSTVVTLSKSKDGVWKMKANRVGTTSLVVTSVDNPQAVASLTVVVNSKVTGVTVEDPNQILYIGEKANLNYTIQPSDATNKEVTWTSSDNEVVKITSTQEGTIAVAQKVGTATLTVTTADGGKTATIIINTRAHVESITLTTQSIKVNRGSTVNLTQFIKSVLPENAYDKSVAWTSGNPNIVSINGSTAVANAIGTCRLTVMSVDNPQATAVLEVTVEAAADGINVDNPIQTVWVGDDVDLGYYFVPADATSNIKSWTSSDPSVVAISGDGTTTAYRAVAQKSGTAVLTVTTDNGQTATIQVTVYAHVEAIRLTVRSIRVNRGTTTGLDQYIDAILPEDAYNKSVTWAVTDTATVVSVSQSKNGWQMTANRVGQTTLQVTSVDNPQVQAFLMVTVESVSDEIQAEEPEQTIWIGESVNLGVVFDRPDATTTISSWTSSNPDVVSVKETENGYEAVGVAAGEATLTGTTDNGLKVTIDVTVHAHVDDMKIGTEKIAIQKGATVSLGEYVHFSPEDAYNKAVVWTSDDESIASVSGSGTDWSVTGVANGQTILMVTSLDNPDVTARLVVTVSEDITGITIELDELVVYQGDTMSLDGIATVQPAGTSDVTLVWTSSNPDVASVVYDEENDSYAVIGKERGEAILTVSTPDGEHSAEVPVRIVIPVSDIEITVSDVTLTVGDSFNLNSAASIVPSDADAVLSFALASNAGRLSLSKNASGDMIATALAAGEESVRVWAEGYSIDTKDHYIRFKILPVAESITVSKPYQEVMVGDYVDLSYTITPADANSEVTWSTSDASIVSIETNDGKTLAPAHATGEAVLTVTTVKGGKKATIRVIVSKSSLEGFKINTEVVRMTKRDENQEIVITPIPVTSSVDLSKFSVTVNDPYSLGNNWKYVSVEEPQRNADGTISIFISDAYSWSNCTLDISYDGPSIGSVKVYVEAIVDLSEGWNWLTLPVADYKASGVSQVGTYFGDGLEEVRTQVGLLYNDPEYGFFGTIEKLQGNLCYKMNFESTPSMKSVEVVDNGSKGLNVTLGQGWNWIAYPYEYTYSMDELTAAGDLSGAAEGDMLVGVNSFTTYDGSNWTGSLTELKPVEGYMYLSASDRTLRWNGYKSLSQKIGSVPVRANGRHREPVWNYDIHAFADNMPVIAVFEGIDIPDDYTVGAFIDGECRGEGKYVDGVFFITVHGEPGEQISFVLHNEITGEWYTVMGGLSLSQSAGNLKNPVRFKVGAKTTSIEDIQMSDENVNSTTYDMMGRRISEPVGGMYIINGQKTLVK
ncbi:MAG: ribosomal protein L7/L12 [Bacteroidaceae bacterium]|nr:ribosomal protein L7/L12 [Bacteroidaceae bacterium]